jgi:hypothetical protein
LCFTLPLLLCLLRYTYHPLYSFVLYTITNFFTYFFVLSFFLIFLSCALCCRLSERHLLVGLPLLSTKHNNTNYHTPPAQECAGSVPCTSACVCPVWRRPTAGFWICSYAQLVAGLAGKQSKFKPSHGENCRSHTNLTSHYLYTTEKPCYKLLT